jgi:hypothetical protein
MEHKPGILSVTSIAISTSRLEHELMLTSAGSRPDSSRADKMYAPLVKEVMFLNGIRVDETTFSKS